MHIVIKVILNKKNYTHVKKVGHTSEFPFDIYWWTLKNLKNQIFQKMKRKKNIKKFWRYYHFTHVYQKPQLYEVQFLRCRIRQNLLLFCAIFCPFTPHLLTTQKTKNFEKNEKAIWRCHHFKAFQQQTRSYDVCLLRYGVRQA